MAKSPADRCIVLGVSGSISAYKSGELVRRLQDENYTVTVVMTREAEQFISPLTLATLSGQKVARDMFSVNDGSWQQDHIGLADRAGLLLVAPATAHIIAKMACGLADDLITATALATTAPKLIAPAMNTRMYAHPATEKNIQTLKSWGYGFVGPEQGRLACGTEGLGHLASIPSIVAAVKAILV